MREILFRGKRIDNGEWVYGNLIEDKWGDDNGNTVYAILQDRVAPEIAALWIPARVIPETVGQYTGLTDKNGKKIFEGDIVKSWSSWWRTPGLIEVETYEVVCKHLGGLYLKRGMPNGEKSTSLNRSSTVEVIGNKWDNPELLKEGKQ